MCLLPERKVCVSAQDTLQRQSAKSSPASQHPARSYGTTLPSIVGRW
ncbi:unannotated protein [freshwater metagenome]|uniref:Unannotated protein n=1 Tax=freshwater metagenome TaxID=449393 RepID=A0A6J7IHM0_9ZZZZ